VPKLVDGGVEHRLAVDDPRERGERQLVGAPFAGAECDLGLAETALRKHVVGGAHGAAVGGRPVPRLAALEDRGAVRDGEEPADELVRHWDIHRGLPSIEVYHLFRSASTGPRRQHRPLVHGGAFGSTLYVTCIPL